MGLILRTIIAITIISCSATNSKASWQGPTEIVNGKWGQETQNFGIEYGDTSDRFPDLSVILFDGKIIISDQVNERICVYNSDGSINKIVPWNIYQNDQKIDNPEYGLYHYLNVQGYTSDGKIWIKFDNYILVDASTGLTVQTNSERPLELGRRKGVRIDTQYRTTITYPDAIYNITASHEVSNYIRDMNRYLYDVTSYTVQSGEAQPTAYNVYKYDHCGKEIGKLTGPVSQYVPPTTDDLAAPTWKPKPTSEYGEPVIGPNGDVYAWVRSTTDYKIVKWSWVDSPTDPKSGPDAPTGLSIMPSTTGLYLTWKSSPQDPGCVSGYEIARATSSGGVYTTLATVNSGVLKYNDTTATAGTTYYYKVRAVSGTDYSPYTAEASGKR